MPGATCGRMEQVYFAGQDRYPLNFDIWKGMHDNRVEVGEGKLLLPGFDGRDRPSSTASLLKGAHAYKCSALTLLETAPTSQWLLVDFPLGQFTTITMSSQELVDQERSG